MNINHSIRYHSIMESSSVNGPGRRVVLWMQGCRGMSCAADCWNKSTHSENGGHLVSVLELMARLTHIFEHDPGLEGLTISGGEPTQQLMAAVSIVNGVRMLFPDKSIGLFSGYSETELNEGRYECAGIGKDIPNEFRAGYWAYFKTVLDFAVLGRYTKGLPSDQPLVTSSNQRLRLYSDRYKLSDFAPQSVEITIAEDGFHQVTGFPVRGGFDA